MSLPRVLTAAALGLFFIGNLVVVRQHSANVNTDGSTAAVASATAGAAPAPEVLLADATMRQLRREVATTNALLGRAPREWHDDAAATTAAAAAVVGGRTNPMASNGYQQLRGGSTAAVAKQAAKLKSELWAQKDVLSSRLHSLDSDLTGITTRVQALEHPQAGAGSKPSLDFTPLQHPPPPPPPQSPPQSPPPPMKVQRSTTLDFRKPVAVAAASEEVPIAAFSISGGGGGGGGEVPPLGQETPILMICFERADYLSRSLEAVRQYHPGEVPVVVSQDGTHGGVNRVAQSFKQQMANSRPNAAVVHVQHPQNRRGGGGDGYHKLAAHYGWALNQVFSVLPKDGQLPVPPRRVIILEEDLEISPDFFDYFAATAPLLEDPDENLLAVSAWNDNGQDRHVSDARAVYRSSFFPGLGWMMTSQLWQELGPKWPQAYWDDWLREPPQQRGRELLRPEICRTFHFATQGVSNNQYSDFLTSIRLNKDTSVDWRSRDLSFLKKKIYDSDLMSELKRAPAVTLADARAGRFPIGHSAVRVEYASTKSFESFARRLGIMDNIKAGVPRGAYHGVVTVRLGSKKQKVHVSLPLAQVTF